MSSETILRTVELAFQYGPFFFSVFFLVVVSRWTYKIYKDACIRKEPPATEKELLACRGTFITSFVFGILLVGAAVVWWFVYRPTVYVYRGTIRDLKTYEMVASDTNVFFKPEPSETEYRNEHFVIVQDAPFKQGQVFEVLFSKKGENDPLQVPGKGVGESPSPVIEETRKERQRRNRLQFQWFPGEDNPTFEIVFDDNDGRNVLRKVESTISGRQHSAATVRVPLFENVVYAPNISVPRFLLQPQGADDAQLVKVLQDIKTDVGTKIVILEHLVSLDATSLQKFVKIKSLKEPVLATILDLTRHSDKELAFKANEITRNLRIEDYLVKELSSAGSEERKDAEKVLLRMDKAQAERVLQRVNASRSSDLRALADKVASGSKAMSLKPTGSASGDRYYVKAVWDPNNPTIVECLTKLFNSRLLTNRTLAQERALMKGRGDRLAYSIDKEWALGMADNITACGGTASFVSLAK